MSLASLTTRDRSTALERALEDVRASRPAATRVLQLTDDPETDARRVAEAIDADPMLTAQVLRLANSAAFGMSFRVASTQLAVSVLGFSAVRSVAVLLASGLRNHKVPTPTGFWQHSAATAAACSALASRFGVSKGEAFSLGLLHDMGWPILYGVDRAAYDGFASGQSDTGAVCAEEIAAFGMSHAEVASMVLASWRFPEPFVGAIAVHHEMSIGTTSHERLLIAGDALAHLVLEPSGLVDVSPLELESLGIPPQKLQELSALTLDYANEVLATFPMA